jgi:serine/threonine-protein kinase
MTRPCARCGAPLPVDRLDACPLCLLTAELAPATLGDALELVEEIGRGGMGCVYKARHRRLGRTVAVKLLSAAAAAHEDSRRRFEREARALAQLDHPNVVAVHDFGEADGQAYIVMEYVAGRPLAEALPLSAEAAVDVALQVLDALAAAHRHGIVHRDVKPSNILMDERGHVKVGDFGIARLLGDDAKGWTVTDARGAVGTPHYMAPEALAGAAPDPRMDIFSVGVVLYETVTGRLPIGTFEPLPGPLDHVVRKALAPDPAQRYANAGAMRLDLERSRLQPTPAGLGPDEANWLRAVALLQSLATASALWALLLSITPRIVAPGDVLPLIMIGSERLADGRILSRARFETAPTLLAVALIAIATAAYGLLRRHWRQSGLETHEPDRSVPQSRLVFYCGVVAIATYAFRHLVLKDWSTGASAYIPPLGGLIELAALFLVWVSILEARRIGRPLIRELPLWIGFALALAPPALDLFRYLSAWRP